MSDKITIIIVILCLMFGFTIGEGIRHKQIMDALGRIETNLCVITKGETNATQKSN